MSAIFILDQKGNTLIRRSYRGDVPLTVVDSFVDFLLNEEIYIKPPVVEIDGVFYAFTKHDNIYLLMVTNSDDNAMLQLSFLNKVVEACTEFFNKLNEESIRKNFVSVYEILDEMMDFGFPQTTEAKVLKDYICVRDRFRVKNIKAPSTVTNAVSWRGDGVSHAKNEIFLDVIESINLMVNQNGKVIHSEIEGVIKMKSFLSGMPELKLGLNEKLMTTRSENPQTAKPSNSVQLDDIKFHQCVRLSKFDSDRTISFIPPDGEFDLMTYRLETHVRPPFSVRITTDHRPLRGVSFLINIKSEYRRMSSGNNVRIVVPVPPDADSPNFDTSTGSAKYDPSENSFTWTIHHFGGTSQHELRARFGLPKTENDEGPQKGPETVHAKVLFDIPYFTVSGIQVRYLKIIEKSGYNALPWVRYATRNGNYLVRMRFSED